MVGSSFEVWIFSSSVHPRSPSAFVFLMRIMVRESRREVYSQVKDGFEIVYSVASSLYSRLWHLGLKVYSHRAKSAMKYQIATTLRSFKGSAACDPEYQSARSIQFDARLLCTNNALLSL